MSEEYKTGRWDNDLGLPHDTENKRWIKRNCPKCGSQLYSYDNGQGCGIVCSNYDCDFREGG